MQMSAPKRLLHLFILNMYQAAFARHGTDNRLIKAAFSIGQTYAVPLFHAEHAYAVSGLLLRKLHVILYIGSIE